jgi:multimeric flavodoxin WrbA
MEKVYRVLGINGSGSTEGATSKLLGRAIAECREQEADYQIVDLYKIPYMMPYRGYSHIPDKPVMEVLERMSAADVVIFATPVHWQQPSSLMKLLLDNMTYLEINQRLNGKVAGIIAHSEVDGGFHVVSEMAGTLNHMGFVIPPYATFFKNSNIKRVPATSWMWRDIKLLATNVMQMAFLMRYTETFEWKWNNEGVLKTE